jgi:hypothetical protein
VDGFYGIYVLDLQTEGLALVPGMDVGDVGDPTWSPDGTRIAFEAAPGPNVEQWDIFTVRLDGSELTNLTNTPEESETWPAWSWIRDRIAFVRDGDSLYTIAADGTDERLVTADRPPLASPAWAPDGKAIAYSTDTGQVYVEWLDGRGAQVVVGALGEPAWQTVSDGGTIAPAPTATPSPSPEGAQDIGLGFPVCDVTSVAGTFAPGVDGTAFVATRTGDTGGCPPLDGATQVLAVDVTGDGLADTSYGPLECDQWCDAFAAPDVNRDGDDELLVRNIQFSIAGLKLFEVEAGDGGAAVGPVTVAPPGSATFGYQGFEAGTEPQFWLGGDAGNLDAIRCEPFEGGRALVSTTSFHPIEAPGDRDVTETWFVLEGFDLHVVDVREYAVPVNDDTQPFMQTDGCGANLPYP